MSDNPGPKIVQIAPSMEQIRKDGESHDCGCGCGPSEPTPMEGAGNACCGSEPERTTSDYDRPGYTLCGFVDTFKTTPAGPVPIVKASLDTADRLGTISARLGINRDNYPVVPGLYGMGDPGPDSPVLVTANYKLTFDTLRRHLGGRDLWILVLDTVGVNVWCAAGKGTFSTAELVRQVTKTGLKQVVSHRELIVPQLGATAVSGIAVKKQCGFGVLWGPIRADDIPAYLDAGKKADESMRRVTFTFVERLVLIPVELGFVPKPALIAAAIAFILSGIGPGIFSLSAAWSRGWQVMAYLAVGIFAGTVVTPLLLPWIPGAAFAVKGAITGLAGSVLLALFTGLAPGAVQTLALFALATALSSFLAMNFTGSTPFTSPSGVELEMRRAIPVQIFGVSLMIFIWLAAPFTA